MMAVSILHWTYLNTGNYSILKGGGLRFWAQQSKGITKITNSFRIIVEKSKMAVSKMAVWSLKWHISQLLPNLSGWYLKF